jgi:hypothetical protein
MKLKSLAAALLAAAALAACTRSATAPTDHGITVRADGNGQFGSGGVTPPPDTTQNGGGH